MLKPRNITGVFLICQVICYSVIEETAHVIGKSQSTSEEGARTDEGRERQREREGWRWKGWVERGEKVGQINWRQRACLAQTETKQQQQKQQQQQTEI